MIVRGLTIAALAPTAIFAAAPVISSQPTSATVNAGANATFSVSVNAGSDGVTYEWWSAFGPLFPPQTNATLSLRNVETFDAGSYRAVVKNSSGATTSTVAVLTVSPPSGSTGENYLYANKSGGTGLDLGGNVTVDGAGNTYLVGGFSDTASFGSTSLASAGGTDAFVAKFNRAGVLLWARKAGGTGDDLASGVAVDRFGNVRVIGYFSASATFGTATVSSSGDRDVFLASYDRNGSFLWVRKAGGGARDTAEGIATDAGGNSCIVGAFTGTATFGETSVTSAGAEDIFVAKFSANGVLLWAKRAGGLATDRVDAVALDPSGNPLVTGRFNGSADFGSFSLSAGSTGSAFAAKLDRTGNVVWAKQADGVKTNIAATCAIDAGGNHYLAGAFSGVAVLGSLSVTSRFSTDLFVARYDAGGTEQWAERVGGEPSEGATIGLHSSNALVTASFLTGPAQFDSSGSSTDLFAAKRDEAGNFLWGKQTGASYAEFPVGILVDNAGVRYLSGFFDAHSTDTNLTDFSILLAPLAEAVSAMPPVITIEPQSQTILAGTNATFGVTAAGNGPLTYQWRFNGTNIVGATTASYAIGSVQASHAGRYSVEIASPDGAAISREATLTLFVDTKAPTVAISSPAANARLTNASVLLQGTAKDNFAVARVEYQLGEDLFQTASGATNWSATLTLRPGANIVRVRSVDVSGNMSAVVSRSVIFVVTSPLTLTTNGGGTVTPNLNGEMLEVGQSYTMTAVPSQGHIFQSWTGGLNQGSAKLTFAMQSNLVLHANFIPNPFIQTKGTYYGLFHEEDEVRHESSGFFTLNVSEFGKFTGTIQLNGKRHPLKGQFGPDRRATNHIARPGTNALVVELVLQPSASSGWVRGRITDGLWESEPLGERAVFHAKINPAPLAGKFTVVLPGDTNGLDLPCGNGFGTVTVDGNGNASLAGTLGDGTKATQRAPISASGFWPMYLPLYSGKGSMLGWLYVTNRPASGPTNQLDDITGLVSWIKPGTPRAKMFAAGFTNETILIGSSYLPPAAKTNRVLNFTDGQVVLLEGNLDTPLTNHVSLSADNKITNLSSNRLTLTLVTASGLFNGSVTDPTTGESIPIKGALLQERNSGSGLFMGTNQTGRVTVSE